MPTNRRKPHMKQLLSALIAAIAVASSAATCTVALGLAPLPELVDFVKVGDAQSERDHNVQGDRTYTGVFNGRIWRDAEDGGWYTYDMRVDTKTPLVLRCEYYGDDVRYFDVLVEGEFIDDVKMVRPHPGKFFTDSYTLPRSTLEGKRKVVVCFKPHQGSLAGGIYGTEIRRRK